MTEGEQETGVMDPQHVGFAIPHDLADLALAAAAGFRRLPAPELEKLLTAIRAEIKPKKVTAKKVLNLCTLVGFMFAMQLDEARQKRLAEIGVTTQ